MGLMEGQTRMVETPEAAASLTLENMTVRAVEGLPWPSCQGRQTGMSRQ